MDTKYVSVSVCFFLHRSYVRVVTSHRAGMGKSLYIQRCREALKSVTTDGPHEVIVPIHGPTVTPDTVVGALKPHVGMSHPVIFHLDIAPNVSYLNQHSTLFHVCSFSLSLSLSLSV